MTKDIKIVLDFNKICRICLLPSENMKSLFTSDAVKYLIALASIEITPNDGLPKNLCDTCSSTLYQSCSFKKQIETSDQTLRSYLSEKINLNNTTNDNSEIQDLNKSSTPDKYTSKSQNVKKIKNSEMEAALAQIRASIPSALLTEEKNCKCHMCGKIFSCRGQLTRHHKTHTGIRSHICEVCGKAYMESGSLRKHFLSKHSDRCKPHKCPQCTQSFDLRSTLIRHIRTHTGEKPFGCEVCHKFYPSKSYLNKHRKTHFEIKDKSFICEICSKSFALKDGLKAHLITHSNERPHQCTMCGKSFSMKGSLLSHIKYIHTKEKNYMCQVCAKTFVTKCELNEHMRKHTGEKKEAKHTCVMCNKKLTSSTHLKLHIRSEHTGERPYNCEFCTKSFITAQALKIHTRYHTGERPYSCKYCSKGFVTNESLKVHERVHTGEKPYLCSFCHSSFSQSSTLKAHLKSHS